MNQVTTSDQAPCKHFSSQMGTFHLAHLSLQGQYMLSVNAYSLKNVFSLLRKQ